MRYDVEKYKANCFDYIEILKQANELAESETENYRIQINAKLNQLFDVNIDLENDSNLMGHYKIGNQGITTNYFSFYEAGANFKHFYRLKLEQCERT